MKNNKNVLIVDDCEEIVVLIHRILKEKFPDYRINSASTGLVALQKIILTVPDLVILDINLPDIDGYKICASMKKRTTTKNIRILSLSGENRGSVEKKILGLGADIFLPKPFETQELISAIKELI